MKILCINEANGNNLGDKAIHSGLLDILSNIPFTTKPDIEQIQLSFSKKGISEKKNNKTSIIYNIYNIKPFKKIFLVLRVFNLYIKRRSVIKSKIKKSDLVIIGGGSLIIDNSYVFPINLFLFARICLHYKVRYGLAAVSSRKVRSPISKLLINYTLKNANFIFFRDDISREICKKQFGISSEYIPDFALYNEKKITNKKKFSNSIAINIMGKQDHGYFSNDSNISNYINTLISFIENTTFDFYELFTTGEESDLTTLLTLKETLLTRFPKKTISYKMDSNIERSLNDIYQNHNKIFCTRLHSAILALKNGNQIVCYNWDMKVEGFFIKNKIKYSLIKPISNFSNQIPLFSSLKPFDLKSYSNFVNIIKK